jgi:flagellin
MTVINTNVKAIVAQDSMRSVNLKLATAMERLSTGLRINSAKDDAAGLAISERMNAQVRGFGMAIKNANDGLSMAQTADGAYGEVSSMLQRMRELAVQASNGAMGPLDRQSIQLEIEELKAEIENVATKTHFNNIKLLDGTAKEVVLQVGANQGDTIEVGFDSVRTKDIGSGMRPALTSLGGSTATFDRFEAGDLLVNGVLVGASLHTDDSLSFGTDNDLIAASAIAKVAAINRVTEASGVYAQVNDTRVQGSAMANLEGDAVVGQAEFITINGVVTRAFALTEDNEINRQTITTAINDISAQTGVRAINTGDDSNGILLVADDARNITIEFDDVFDSTNTGLAAAGTYVGTYSLYNDSGLPIEIDHQVGRDITGTGLRMGSFKPDTATMVSLERSGAGVVDDDVDGAQVPLVGESPSTQNVGVLNGDTLVINDISIDAARATDDSASHSTISSAKSASAIAIAAAINKKTDIHGVTAIPEPTVIRSEAAIPFEAGVTADVRLNGVTISVSTVSRNTVIESINAFSGQTGVVARVYGDGLELVAEDGRNISIGTTLDAANLGLGEVQLGTTADDDDAATFYSTVRLESDASFEVRRGSESGDDQLDSLNFQRLGFREGVFGGNNSGVKIADIDVTTQEGAQSAITAIDSALEDVLSAQARSGAYQNRLDAIVSVLSESTENITASRSRILDADYALEATNMAKAQIISQAANAMLAQANQSQQGVLQLLQ